MNPGEGLKLVKARDVSWGVERWRYAGSHLARILVVYGQK